MTDAMPCPSCGSTACWESPPLSERCCGACGGNHENDTYERYYPTPKENAR